jgi:type III secretion protein T
MQELIALAHTFDVEIIAVFLTLPRLYAFLAASQMLNSNAVPGLARAATVVSLATAVVPLNFAHAETMDRSPLTFVAYFGKEVAIGFVLGWLLGWVQWAVQAAGGLIDNQRGAAIASSIDPLQGEEATPLGQMFSQSYLTYVFATGAFLQILGVLYRSYAVWPATRAVPRLDQSFAPTVLGLFDHAMETAILIAGPIVAIMFVAEFALAMVSRFAPQIQVFVIAMPIKSMLAIVVLIFYFSTAIPFAQRRLLDATHSADWFFQLLDTSSKTPAGAARPGP